MNAVKCLGLASCRRRGAGGDGSLLSRKFRVVILGACGGIGQPLSMLMKMSPQVSELRLYDIVNVLGVAADLSHIDTSPKVKAFQGSKELEMALSGCDLVLMAAGVPCEPGVTHDHLFATNAAIVRDLASACAIICPEAFLAVIANPLNSTLPIAASVYEKEGVFDKKRMCGVTTLDVIRSSSLVGQFKKVDPSKIFVPVLGGNCGKTLVPVLSQTKPSLDLEEPEFEALVKQIREAGDYVVMAKSGLGSATLSMAHATARFTSSLLRAMSGAKHVVECAFVRSDVRQVPFFASPVLLGKEGIVKTLDLRMGPLNDLEERLIAEAIPELKRSIQRGLDFVNF